MFELPSSEPTPIDSSDRDKTEVCANVNAIRQFAQQRAWNSAIEGTSDQLPIYEEAKFKVWYELINHFVAHIRAEEGNQLTKARDKRNWFR